MRVNISFGNIDSPSKKNSLPTKLFHFHLQLSILYANKINTKLSIIFIGLIKKTQNQTKLFIFFRPQMTFFVRDYFHFHQAGLFKPKWLI